MVLRIQEMCLFCTPPFMCVCAHSNCMLGVIESQHMERHGGVGDIEGWEKRTEVKVQQKTEDDR